MQNAPRHCERVNGDLLDRDQEARLMQKVADAGQEAPDAFAEIVDAFLAQLTRYCRRMMHQSTDADDIVQEAFAKVWTDAGRFNAESARLSTWLHQIAHNLCVDHFRKHNRLVEEDPTDQDSRINDRADSQDDAPDDLLFAEVTSDQVRQALDDLPERQRSALLLCYYQGLSNRDTAAVLDLTVAALESLLARARRALKQNLADASIRV